MTVSKSTLNQSTGNVNLTCQLCGHTGNDVRNQYWYVGGQGNVLQTICDDVLACIQRKSNGIKRQNLEAHNDARTST